MRRWRMLHRGVMALATAGLLVAGSAPVEAQAMDLPMEIQIPIFLKLLTFDRNLATGVGTELTIAIVFQGNNRESLVARRQADAELRKAVPLFEGLTVRIIPIDLEQERDLGAKLLEQRVHAAYVGPLRAVDIRTILKATRPAQVRTFSGVARFVTQGVAMGATLKGDLPQIIVNLPAAREEGADYPAQVLKLARVVE